jgi:signal peptidase I
MTSKAITAFAVFAFLAALCVTASQSFGIRMVPVLTGSMEPQYPVGSLVITVPRRGDAVQPGDVLAFAPPSPYSTPGNRPIMHRVTRLQGSGEQLAAITRGDANPAPDPWALSLPQAQLSEAVIVVPWAGRVAAAFAHDDHQVRWITLFGTALLGSTVLLWPRRRRFCKNCARRHWHLRNDVYALNDDEVQSSLASTAQRRSMKSVMASQFEWATSAAEQRFSGGMVLINAVSAEGATAMSSGGPDDWADYVLHPDLTNLPCVRVVAAQTPFAFDGAGKRGRRARADRMIDTTLHDLRFKAYAGVPFHSPDGVVLGTLCVLDRNARNWTLNDISFLQSLSASMTQQLAIAQATTADRPRREHKLITATRFAARAVLRSLASRP